MLELERCFDVLLVSHISFRFFDNKEDPRLRLAQNALSININSLYKRSHHFFELGISVLQNRIVSQLSVCSYEVFEIVAVIKGEFISVLAIDSILEQPYSVGGRQE